jgi:predicted unusual protein kinase regulating ubiquinone biosynthesis (AarF/ABC1/UbiB family)
VLQVYGRAVRIAVSLGGFIARVARDAALNQLEERSAVRAVELRKLLSGLGPSFVKIGQALSARPDLLPQVRRSAVMLLGATANDTR